MFFRINSYLLEGDICTGQSHGLLEPADPEPLDAADVAFHDDATTEEAQAARAAAALWVST